MKNLLCIPAIILLAPVGIVACLCWCAIMGSILVAVSPIVLLSKACA
jgi:hypothetical protein